jgi:hypothetical protein
MDKCPNMPHRLAPAGRRNKPIAARRWIVLAGTNGMLGGPNLTTRISYRRSRMKTLALVVLAAVVLSICGEALAVKRQVQLGRENLKEQGFAIAAAKREDGSIDVSITRDLSKARSFDEASGLELVRTATLDVSDQSGTIVRCNLEGERAEGAAASIVYRFTIASEHVAKAHVTVSEIDDYKNRGDQPHLLGGGTFFELKLADVVKP